MKPNVVTIISCEEMSNRSKRPMLVGMRRACHQNGLRLESVRLDMALAGQAHVSNPFFVDETSESRVARLAALFPNHRIINFEDCTRAYKNVSTIHSSTEAIANEVASYLAAAARPRLALFAFDKVSFNAQRYVGAFVRAAKKASCVFSEADSYENDENQLSDCFERFFASVGQYDAVICANDMAALYLIAEAAKRGVHVPDDLFVIGIGNSILSQSVSPGITSIDRLDETRGEQAVDFWRYLRRHPQILRADIFLEYRMYIRESTDLFRPTDTPLLFEKEIVGEGGVDRGYAELQRLTDFLLNIDETDRHILRHFMRGEGSADIAEKTFMTPNGVRYRMKRMLGMIGKHTKSELYDFLNAYHVEG